MVEKILDTESEDQGKWGVVVLDSFWNILWQEVNSGEEARGISGTSKQDSEGKQKGLL